jgi:hypothetical protein
VADKAPEAVPTPPKVYSPTQAPIVAPTASQAPLSTLVEQVAALILAKNWTYSYNAYGVYPFLSKGGALHKIDITDAREIAQAIIDAATGPLTVPYIMACLAIESLFDPKCENGNYSYVGHTGSNPDKLPEGFDVGIAQLKLKYLMEDRKLDVDAAHAFACDVTKAIPYMATTMKLLLGYADALIQDTKRSDIPPPLMNRYCVSTNAYNYGRTGMKAIMQSAKVQPSHGMVVVAYEKQYSKQLNIPSVFQELA